MKTSALALALLLVAPAWAPAFVDTEACFGGDRRAVPPTPPVTTGSFQDGTVELWDTECIEPVGVRYAAFRVVGLSSCELVNVNGSMREVCDGRAFARLEGRKGVFSPAPRSVTLNGITFSMPPLPAPVVTLVSEGCSPCSIGDHARVRAVISNAGTATVVEGRSVLFVPGGFEMTLPPDAPLLIPSGPSALVILDTVVPADAPAGSYYFEVGLLVPSTGATVGRARLRIDLTP